MKKAIKSIIAAGMMVATLALGGVIAQPVFAASAGSQVQDGVNAVGGDENTTDLNAFIKTIINVLLFVIGAVAVVMIIIGGIRYVTSNGEQAHVKAAKDTILYAVVGLVVAMLAYAIVNFVVASIIK